MKKNLILFGSTTGNSEKVANFIKETLIKENIIEIKNTANIKTNFQFTDIYDKYFLICSTWGIDPACLQEDFEIFWLNLNKKSIRNKNFVIIALGDTYYPNFAYAANILVKDIKKYHGNILLSPLKLEENNDSNIILEYLSKLKIC